MSVLFDAAVARRFEAKVMPEPMSGCWLWLGARNSWGYGVFWWRGTNQQANRVAFALRHGRFPMGLGLHSCDTRACVNPSHIREGSYADNSADMVAKGRQATGDKCRTGPRLYGAANPTSKYPAEVIALVKTSSLSHVAAAREFSVGYHTVWKARKGIQWRRG